MAGSIARPAGGHRGRRPGDHRRTERRERRARCPGQVDRDGLHVGRQQPRGLHRQGPRARARGRRIHGERPDHGARRPRPGLRQEPRRLADDQALPRDQEHAGRRRQRRRRLGRAQHGRPADPQAVRPVVEDQLPGRPLRPVFLGPRLGLAPGLDDGGRDAGAGDGLNPDEVKSVVNDLGFIDVVGYDACNMAQIEIVALWTRPRRPRSSARRST